LPGKKNLANHGHEWLDKQEVLTVIISQMGYSSLAREKNEIYCSVAHTLLRR
jgi:hypothetical protein